MWYHGRRILKNVQVDTTSKLVRAAGDNELCIVKQLRKRGMFFLFHAELRIQYQMKLQIPKESALVLVLSGEVAANFQARTRDRGVYVVISCSVFNFMKLVLFCRFVPNQDVFKFSAGLNLSCLANYTVQRKFFPTPTHDNVNLWGYAAYPVFLWKTRGQSKKMFQKHTETF